MPLKRGASRKAVSSNIKELQRMGHKHAQAIAISLNQARKTAAGRKHYGKKR